MCFIGPGAVLTVYTDDERPGKTVRARHDMEKSVHGPGLGVFSYSIGGLQKWFTSSITSSITHEFIVWGIFACFPGFHGFSGFRDASG